MIFSQLNVVLKFNCEKEKKYIDVWQKYEHNEVW